MMGLGAPEVRVQKLDETDLERARRRTGEAQVLDGMVKSAWAMVGLLCRDVERDQDWKILGYHSFAEWRDENLPFSKSMACDAHAMVKQLHGWTDDEIVEMPYSNAKLITSKIPESRQTPALKRAARTLKPDDFAERIIRDEPDLHLERTAWMNVPFEESQKKIVKGALELYRAIECDEGISYAAFFEALAASYIREHMAEAKARMLR